MNNQRYLHFFLVHVINFVIVIDRALSTELGKIYANLTTCIIYMRHELESLKEGRAFIAQAIGQQLPADQDDLCMQCRQCKCLQSLTAAKRSGQVRGLAHYSHMYTYKACSIGTVSISATDPRWYLIDI